MTATDVPIISFCCTSMCRRVQRSLKIAQAVREMVKMMKVASVGDQRDHAWYRRRGIIWLAEWPYFHWQMLS